MPLRSLRPLAVVPLAALVVIACSGGASGPSGPPGSDGSSPGPASPAKTGRSPDGGPAGSGGGSGGPPFPGGGDPPPRALLQAVSADAAARAGVGPAAVSLVGARAVEWPDGSLGCPQPGMVYTQAIVAGWQIVVRAADRDYDYRVVAADRFRLCTSR